MYENGFKELRFGSFRMTIVIDYEVVLILQHPLSVIFIIIFSPKTN